MVLKDQFTFNAVLEQKMESIEKKLDEMNSDFKDMLKVLNKHAEENAVNRNDLNNFGKTIRDHELRLKSIEDKQTGLITKVSTITSVIVLIAAAILNKIFK